MFRRVLRLAPFAMAAASLSLAPLAGASERPATHRATCDEIPGQNEVVTDRWRVFNAAGQGDMAITPEPWACERSTAPVRRVLELWPLGVGVVGIAGDVVAIEWSGRYGNYGGTFLDLSTLRAAPRYGDAPVSPNATLLDTGVIVSLPYNGEGRGREDPVPAGQRVGQLTVTDADGDHVIEPGSTWTADATTFLSFAPAASGVRSFGAGFYYTAADGSLRRHLPVGGPASTANWRPTSKVKWKRFTRRVPNRPGIKTTYVGFRELHARAARGTRPASLTLHTPYDESLDRRPHASDLVARLVPGSESELQLEGSLVIGRFADRPAELRLRLPIHGRANRFRVDLPAPPSIDRSTATGGDGDVVYLDGADLVFLIRDQEDFSYDVRRMPAPAGFRDPVLIAPTRDHAGQVLYTGADGAPALLDYRPAEAPY